MKNIRFRLLVAVVLANLFAVVLAQEKSHAIYPEGGDARQEIQTAIAKADREHKRVILDFGGNWCGDCRALDRYFHQDPNAALLKANFVLVDINIGRFDKNVALAEKYGVPLKRGVPALAVLDHKGSVLYSQKNGEFESMRSMDPGSVTQFLQRWSKAPRP